MSHMDTPCNTRDSSPSPMCYILQVTREQVMTHPWNCENRKNKKNCCSWLYRLSWLLTGIFFAKTLEKKGERQKANNPDGATCWPANSLKTRSGKRGKGKNNTCSQLLRLSGLVTGNFFAKTLVKKKRGNEKEIIYSCNRLYRLSGLVSGIFLTWTLEKKKIEEKMKKGKYLYLQPTVQIERAVDRQLLCEDARFRHVALVWCGRWCPRLLWHLFWCCVTWPECDATHVWRDSCVTWLIHDVTHAWRDSHVCVSWRIHVRHDSFYSGFRRVTLVWYGRWCSRLLWHLFWCCVTWPVCDATHVWRDSCVTWLICDVTFMCVWRDSFMCAMTHFTVDFGE